MIGLTAGVPAGGVGEVQVENGETPVLVTLRAASHAEGPWVSEMSMPS